MRFPARARWRSLSWIRGFDSVDKGDFAKVDEALSGLDWSQSGATAGPPVSVVLDPPSVRAETAALRSHAASLQDHAAAFQQGVQGLSF